MLSDLRELYKYRDLVAQLVIRDLKVRYKNSVLGFFWSLINPLVQVAIITIVIKVLLLVRIPNYSAYLLAAFLPWMFFQMSLLDASDSVLKHHDLLKKVYFPREALPVSLVISNLIHLILAFIVFFIYLVTIPRAPIYSTALLLPVLMAIQFIFNLGVAFFISCLNVFYEDTKFIVAVGLNALFYASPVMYVSELAHNALMHSHRLPAAFKEPLWVLYQINPLNALLMGYRKILLSPFPEFTLRGAKLSDMPMNWGYLGIAALISILLAIVGYRFFNKRKWGFAEML
ncbi:MAG: ABC transporter permease [Armatimonadota bacterium]|nr:ABC transporter permease [Armatimonadota bacterium]